MLENNNIANCKQILILGSTGSIGQQTLDVIQSYPKLFKAHTLTAGTNADLLIEQAIKFLPNTVVIADESKYDIVKSALDKYPIKVFAGSKALSEVVENKEIDIVVSALVGFSGLEPTIKAIEQRKVIALANKETLVAAGSIIIQLAQKYNVPILPIDSEHSAIFQSLAGATHNSIEKIILTASGGPFRSYTQSQLENVSLEQALKHPNWNMGTKITIDSASMMNKGFEMIEAKWLFSISPKDIEILIHPESIIHSAVQFEDGAIIAQLGLPDMHLPIQYALSYPFRLPLRGERLSLSKINTLHFEQPDLCKFPCLELAYYAINKGGNIPCALNAANEIVNVAFRRQKINFLDIPKIIEQTINNITYIEKPQLEDIFNTNQESRQIAEKLL